jgi:ABC-type branched-subunit amino acid transport system substrate-binding protein
VPVTTRDGWLFFLLCVTGACEEQGKPGGAVTFGTILSLTSSSADLVRKQLQAEQLAVEEINAAGGLLGSKLTLEVRDDNGQEPMGTTQAHELIDQLHVPAIVGSYSSAITLAIAAVTAPANVVLISGSATSPEITTLPDGGFVFRTCPPDTAQGRLISARARAHPFSRVAVIYDPSAYGRGLGYVFAVDFLQRGGTVTDVVTYSVNAPSYASLLDHVYSKSPEAILLVAYPPEAATIIKDYISGFATHNTFWAFTDTTEDQGFVDNVGGSNFTFQHEGTGPGTATGDAFTNFERAYVARFGEEPTQFAPNDYDALYLLALATVQAGAANGLAIRDQMREVANPPGMVVGPGQFAQAAAAIRAGMKINYEGASGSVDLDQYGDPVATYIRWQVVGGQVTVVERGLSP